MPVFVTTICLKACQHRFPVSMNGYLARQVLTHENGAECDILTIDLGLAPFLPSSDVGDYPRLTSS